MPYTAFDRFVAWRRFCAAIPHVRAGARICDIGCGLEAAFLSYARPRINFGVGLDYRVSPRESTGAAIVRADIARGLPLRSASFDHAVMLAVLEHLRAPVDVLQEAFRILIPGGSLIVTWPNPIVDSILTVTKGIGLTSPEMESDKHEQRVPLPSLLAMLKAIGFHDFLHRRFEFGLNNLLVARKPLSKR